jgi:hypothetical protein
MMAIQIVDSQYLLRLLREKAGTSAAFLDAYRRATAYRLSPACGQFFEAYFHRRVEDVRNDLVSIKDICWSKRNQEEGLSQLNAANMYWVPSTQNYPRVDSALLCSRTLYVFQLTIQSKKEYDATKLDEEFVSRVRQNLDFDNTVVYFVVPKRTNFDPPGDTTSVTFKTFEIDLTSLESTAISLQSLFNSL